ncbi:MAG: antitoxin HicB [Candidatus Yanofskybacteria bacterium RIFCSPLOWO2_01_FULL_49_25]|uniref:Antitoxin HicB n=1 Tax=Candidatus Yanofskybacteria bacterium RIFCSPLOWO2_01_FULL_49_25 TaxID=1802701 RepID=A0A1F8GWM0_9BACT|nr:MAG: antitoxin HicB [Candidatus Yanofskybacteria bacterium RIFCSPLOWO2_01_FULL_49_25]
MLIGFIENKMNQAKYKLLKDGSYFGSIPGLKGVWADAKTLEKCRAELQEVLEDWLVLKLRSGDHIGDLPLPRLHHSALRHA